MERESKQKVKEKLEGEGDDNLHSTGLEGKNKIPADIDITPLDFIEYRDITRIAKETNFTPQHVSKVKNLKSYNVKILSALLKKGRANKALLDGATK